MLKWIVGASARFHVLMIAIAATLLAIGIARLPQTQIEALPDFGPVRVEIQTEALGLSPEEAENLITNPMEQEFFTGIPWLHKIRSNSAPGLSSVEMIFEPGTNDVRARQVVQERLTMVPALPAVSKPPYVIQPSATTSRLMLIGLSSDKLSLIDLSTLARWKIRQRLLSVPGVSSVSIWGLRDRQLQVLIDPHRLRLNGVDVEEVTRTAANAMWSSPLTYVEASTPGTGGFIDTANQRISINHRQPIKTATELAKVTIEGNRPKPLTIGEVAEVVEGHQLLIGDAVLQNGTGLMMVVERSPGTGIATVTGDVERALDAMRPGLQDIRIDTSVFRAASYVEAAGRSLAGSLGFGLIMLLLVVAALTFDWRATLISLSSITLSLVAAGLVLSAYGVMFNLMIVAGLVLAVAVVVDDAVVCVDSVGQRLAERHSVGLAGNPPVTIVTAIAYVGGPIATGLAIVVATIAPLLVLGEIRGDFVRPLVLTYALVVSMSLLVALTVTPAVALMLMSAPPGRESPLASRLAGGYARALERVVQKPSQALAAVAVALVGGLAVSPLLGRADLLPSLNDRSVVVRLQAAPGTSLPAMTKIASAASAELRSIAGVRSVGGHVGRASNSDLVTSVDRAELWVAMKPDADYRETLAAIEETMASRPGTRSEVGAYANLRLRELAPSEVDDLVVRVYGRDYKVLQAKAEMIAKVVADIPGIVAPSIALPPLEPMIEIEVDISKASAQGVKPGDVRRASATMLSSITAGNLFEDQKIFDVVVWGAASKRGHLTAVQDLLVDAPNDSQVRVGDVADVRIRPNPSVIRHDAVSRYIDVTASVRGASLASVTDQVEERLGKISFPSEHHVEVLGDAAEREELDRDLLLYGLAGAIVIYFLLQARFDSWWRATLLFALLPLPLAGAALGAATQGRGASVLALLGALAVIAVAVRNGMLMIERWQRLEHEAVSEPDVGMVKQGAREGFHSIMVATAASVVALLPLVAYGSSAGMEIVKPLAATVISGLLASALTNLFVLPALYLRFAPPRVANDASTASAPVGTPAMPAAAP